MFAPFSMLWQMSKVSQMNDAHRLPWNNCHSRYTSGIDATKTAACGRAVAPAPTGGAVAVVRAGQRPDALRYTVNVTWPTSDDPAVTVSPTWAV